MDIVDGLPNWSDRNLRWFVDYIARRNNNAGRATYTVIQRKAWALLNDHSPTGQIVGDKYEAAGHFILAGVGGHEFARCKSITDCHELANRMGLGIVPHLYASGHFGHAMIATDQ